MWMLLGTVLIASLLGSLHCVGMCGPFAMLAAASNQQRRSVLFPAAAYSLGRLVTYTIVGVIFGSLGMALNRGSSLILGIPVGSVQQTATFVAGGLMIAVGVIALGRQLGMRIKLPMLAGRVSAMLQVLFRRVTDQPPLRKAFSIGALSCLMPCGWLYTFAIVAAGTASPLWGAVVMVAFWSGTVPIMVALMMGLSRIGRSIQQRIPVAMAGLVILIGVFTIAFRAPIAIGSDMTVIHETDDLIQQVRAVDHTELPCCRGE
jgi:sulfite exporter TauE/SafE